MKIKSTDPIPDSWRLRYKPTEEEREAERDKREDAADERFHERREL